MDKQISLRKRILDCKDVLSICNLTSSDYFKNNTDRYYHFYYNSFFGSVNAVKSFLYANGIITDNIRFRPYIEVSVLRLHIDFDDVREGVDEYFSRFIGSIEIPSTYSFPTILNRVLRFLVLNGCIKELPF